jgi:hypothetical protein
MAVALLQKLNQVELFAGGGGEGFRHLFGAPVFEGSVHVKSK